MNELDDATVGEPTNESRIAKAARALEEYSEEDGNDILDLLTDLRHWCAANKIDFDVQASLSQLHFLVESDNDPTAIRKSREMLKSSVRFRGRGISHP